MLGLKHVEPMITRSQKWILWPQWKHPNGSYLGMVIAPFIGNCNDLGWPKTSMTTTADSETHTHTPLEALMTFPRILVSRDWFWGNLKKYIWGTNPGFLTSPKNLKPIHGLSDRWCIQGPQACWVGKVNWWWPNHAMFHVLGEQRQLHRTNP